MGILRNMFNNKNNQPQVNKDTMFDYIVNYFDNDTDFDVNSKGVVNVSSDIYAITSRIANDLANKSIKSTNSYVAGLINNHINDYTNAHDFWVSIIMNMLIFGDGIALIRNDNSKGTISGLEVLPSYDVAIIKGSSGLSYRYNNVTYPSDQIIHLRFNPLNSLTGSNPMVALKNTLKLSRASDQLLNSYFSDTAFQRVLLQANGKLSADDREKLKNAFKRSIGSDHGGCLVSDDTVTIKPFSATNVGAETIKQIKANDAFKKAITATYGVPYELLGVVNSHSNGSDILSRYRMDLKRYENIITAELNNKLNGTYQIIDPIDPLTASDVANLVKSGVINSAEGKQYLGFN